MPIYSMGGSIDGFITDREGDFGWTDPARSSFVFHIAQVGELGGYLYGRGSTRRCWCGRRIRRCATTISGRRSPTSGAQSRRSFSAGRSAGLRATPGSPRLHWPRRSLRLDATYKDVELGFVDELRILRNPVVIGGGTPFLPPVTKPVPMDLVETRTFGSRVIYQRYRRAGDGSD